MTGKDGPALSVRERVAAATIVTLGTMGAIALTMALPGSWTVPLIRVEWLVFLVPPFLAAAVARRVLDPRGHSFPVVATGVGALLGIVSGWIAIMSLSRLVHDLDSSLILLVPAACFVGAFAGLTRARGEDGPRESPAASALHRWGDAIVVGALMTSVGLLGVAIARDVRDQPGGRDLAFLCAVLPYVGASLTRRFLSGGRRYSTLVLGSATLLGAYIGWTTIPDDPRFGGPLLYTWPTVRWIAGWTYVLAFAAAAVSRDRGPAGAQRTPRA